MNYRLAILTHGDSAPLAETLASFAALVLPWPTSVRIFADGSDGSAALDAYSSVFGPTNGSPPSLGVTHPSRSQGFCVATERLWQDSATSDADFVFWLEHDFRFTRALDLEDLAAALADPTLAQMALVRNAESENEIAAGGLVASRPGEFTPVVTARGPLGSGIPVPWLAHSSYFTTNPSLMRRSFMAENPWPSYPQFCEGRFGIDLIERGYYFGAWGEGDAWVQHIGVRTGTGY